MNRPFPLAVTRHLPALTGILALSWSALTVADVHRHGPFPIEIAEARAAAEAAFENLDEDGDGMVSRSEFMSAPSLRGAWPGHGEGPHGRHRMHGPINPDAPEAARAAGRERREAHDEALFQRLDTDGDGVLSPEEFGSGEIRQARSGMTRERLFERLDQSGSGALSREEFTGWLARLEAMDADGNGVVTREEAKAHPRAGRGAAD